MGAGMRQRERYSSNQGGGEGMDGGEARRETISDGTRLGGFGGREEVVQSGEESQEV